MQSENKGEGVTENGEDVLSASWVLCLLALEKDNSHHPVWYAAYDGSCRHIIMPDGSSDPEVGLGLSAHTGPPPQRQDDWFRQTQSP